MNHTNRDFPYGSDPWKLIETGFDPDRLPSAETIFTCANGYLGIRGASEERTPSYHPGTYINGIYETKPIAYGEHAYGFAAHSQTILNLTDSGIIQLYVDDDLFDLSTGDILEYRRTLDIQKGTMSRTVLWRSPSGKTVRVETTRMVSFTRRHLAVYGWSCTLLEREAVLTVLGIMNGAVKNLVGFDDPRIGAKFKEQVLEIRKKKAQGNLSCMTSRVRNSGFYISCAALDVPDTLNRFAFQKEADRHRIISRFVVNASAGVPFSLTRYVSYFTTRDTSVRALSARACAEVTTAADSGFPVLLEEQRVFLDAFWARADIRIEGDELMSQSLRFNAYHILQGTGTDGTTNAPAKGLTGEGYDGHYFWDSEIYILPLFLYTRPGTARTMLEYRYFTLDKARLRAAELSHRGALFPWRTINGEEASAYFPAGTAQYHINADIAYAVKKYVEVTGDHEFLCLYGAEIVLETARFWMTIGDFIPGRGFCINTVTGPDEYSALVNNNVYTNLMARMNLEYGLSVLALLRTEYVSDYERITETISFSEQEADTWKTAAQAMYLPWNKELGIYAQDDSFLQRAQWNLDAVKRKHPLLLHFHPLTIYRYQLLKQPDLVLAQFLLGNRFTASEKKRHFDYYDPLITGDSSLGPCIQSVMSAEVGYLGPAYEYFMKTARMDLDDINGNVRDGVHMAAMAGTWTAIVYGFAGFRDYDGSFSFKPRLPSRWTRLAFRLTIRTCLLEIDCTPESVRYTLLEGERLNFTHWCKPVTLGQGETAEFDPRPVLRAVIFDIDTLPVQFLRSDELPALLRRLAGSSIKAAAVTESPSPDGFFRSFPGTVLDGSRLTAGRPDSQIFLDASESLMERPEDCMVITGNADGARAAADGSFFTAAFGAEDGGSAITERLRFEALHEAFLTGMRDPVRHIQG